MVHKHRCSRCGAYLVALVGALLTAAFAITPQARSAVAQAKDASSRTIVATREAKLLSLKATKPVSNPFQSIHRDLLNLEEGQKDLQRQLQGLTGVTRRRADDLEQRIDSLSGPLNRLAATQQASTAMQQLLKATIRSMRLLLMVTVGLLLVLCGALFFFVYQLKQFRGFLLKDRKQIPVATEEDPEGAIEPQWKVSS